MENTTIINPKHIYTGEEITLILGGIGAMVASFVYAMKNVKHLKSGCCECDQAVTATIPIDDEEPEISQV
tara:strand:+ start:2670 stop:2879 length:210 start_codon:yes stop_codon:yes gene_type:complete